MVERIDQAQSLIEKLLCLCVFGRNRMVQIAEARHPRDRLHRPRSMILRGGHDCYTKSDREDDRFQSFKVARVQSRPPEVNQTDFNLDSNEHPKTFAAKHSADLAADATSSQPATFRMWTGACAKLKPT